MFFGELSQRGTVRHGLHLRDGYERLDRALAHLRLYDAFATGFYLSVLT